MTAGDEGRPGGWVPTEPPAEPPAEPPVARGVVEDPDTQPLTRASLREAREAQARRHAPRGHGAGRGRHEPSGARSGAASGATSAPPSGATSAPPSVSPLAVATVVALAALLGLSALVGPTPTALAVGFAGVVMVWGWAVLTDAPSRRTATLVVGAGVVAICLTVVLTRTEPYLVWVPAAVAVSVAAAFLHQVFRGGGRPRLTEGVASSVSALAVTASGVAMVPLTHDPDMGPWVLVAMVPVAVAGLLMLFSWGRARTPWALLATVVLGAAAGAVTGWLLGGIPPLGAALVGLLASAISQSLLRVLLALPRARAARAAIAAGAASVLVVGVVTYLLARVYAG